MYEKLYNELLLRYGELKAKNQKLEEENLRLRERLGITSVSEKHSETMQDVLPTVHKYSSSKAKIDLFRSLFKGREDVFAKRWQSVASGKSGYQPVCENEWAEGLCDKRKFKCAVCPNRVLKPLSDEVIYKHLEGKDALARDVVGIYPMCPDETCHFCARILTVKRLKRMLPRFGKCARKQTFLYAWSVPVPEMVLTLGYFSNRPFLPQPPVSLEAGC